MLGSHIDVLTLIPFNSLFCSFPGCTVQTLSSIRRWKEASRRRRHHYACAICCSCPTKSPPEASTWRQGTSSTAISPPGTAWSATTWQLRSGISECHVTSTAPIITRQGRLNLRLHKHDSGNETRLVSRIFVIDVNTTLYKATFKVSLSVEVRG